nr:FYDLN acid domain-containing protein [Methylocystis sp. WRRC1]
MKRRCLSCNALFFDLNRAPIVCPKCAAVFQVVEIARSQPRRTPARPAAAERPPPVDAAEADLALPEVEVPDDESDILPIEEDEEIKVEDIVEIERDNEGPNQ